LTAALVAAALVFGGCGDDGGTSSSDTSDPADTPADTGGDTTSGDSTDGVDDSTADDDADADSGTDDGDTVSDAGSDVAAGMGFIQIGDLRHDLTVELCANIFDAVNGRAVGTGDAEAVKVVFNLSPEDWQDRGDNFGYEDAGSIQYIESQTPSWSTGLNYIGDYEIPADVDVTTLGISSYDISDDGQSVSGEATFYDLNALVYATPVAPETGSFAFACPAS
jgi:hypothetical protein